MKRYIRKEVIEAITFEQLNQLIIDSKINIVDGKRFLLGQYNYFFTRINDGFLIEDDRMTYVLNKNKVFYVKKIEKEIVKIDVIEKETFEKYYELKINN